VLPGQAASLLLAATWVEQAAAQLSAE